MIRDLKWVDAYVTNTKGLPFLKLIRNMPINLNLRIRVKTRKSCLLKIRSHDSVNTEIYLDGTDKEFKNGKLEEY